MKVSLQNLLQQQNKLVKGVNMPEGLNKTLVPPSKRTTNFFYKGLVLFYPESIFGTKEGRKRAVLNYWSETGYRRTEFAKLLWNVTKTEDTDQAAKIVLEWKKLWDENKQPETTVPENLDELLTSLDESATGEKKLNTYNKQALAKKTLLESQKLIEKPTPAPEPEFTVSSAEAISKAAGPLSTLAGNTLAAPFKAFTFFAGPATYSSSEKGEGPGVATARYMLAHGISSTSIRSLENKAQQLGITPSQLKNLATLIKTEQETHPFSFKWVSVIYSGQKASLSQAQIVSLLVPSTDGSMAVLPRKSFVGNLFGRVGQQLFGKIAKKALKTIGKKIASKVATTAATQAAATAIAPGIANIIVLVGQAIIGKIKNLISSLKSKEGKERILALIFGSMVVGGIVLGGPLGAFLVVGGLVPGLGFMATKAGGFGPLGSSVGGYGQAFLAGITGVLLPAIGAPVIIAIISIPLLIAIILFIINSGAYIVPPKTSLVPGAIESPYIGIEKEASPDKMDNISGQATITYNVKIFAKKGTLTNINIANEYKIISEGSPAVPNPQVEKINNPPKIISPTQDYEFQYQISVGPEYNDSVVVDSLSVTADAPEQQGATARESASVIIGNPPMHCPVPGAYYRSIDGSYSPGDETKGHGSNNYWNRMRERCTWRLPQGVCWGPSQSSASSNYCYGKSGSCPYYGYALDVWPTGTNDVFAPTVEGKSVTWSYSHTFKNSSGWSHVYRSSNYYLVLTHLNSNANKGSNIIAGEKIGELFPQGGNTHLHIEFSINGQYQRPEEFFCF
jgi:hypothetical protein